MRGCSGKSGPHRPSAPIENLRRRAELLERTRAFFTSRGALEVETPILARGVVVDRHLDPPVCRYGRASAADEETFYLQTSPEAPMKRLLAAGSGPIYQITRAFRERERGRLHNPEFTIVEWYRPGCDHHRLMREVADLLHELLGDRTGGPGFEEVTYRRLFLERLGLDPLECSTVELEAVARDRGVSVPPGMEGAGRDAWLDLLLVTLLEPGLGHGLPTFVHDYPASQAALARLSPADPRVGERFELYVRGLEIANGYHELLDACEQRRRFEEANRWRREAGKPPLAADELLLAALEEGLPQCAGVALGFDRVVMLACGAESIDEVIAFPFDRV